MIIRTFRSTDDRDEFLEASGGLVEQFSIDIDGLPQIVGATWIVTTEDEATSRRIRDILGGELR